MSTTSTAIYSNPLFATYSVYARNASIMLITNVYHAHYKLPVIVIDALTKMIYDVSNL